MRGKFKLELLKMFFAVEIKCKQTVRLATVKVIIQGYFCHFGLEFCKYELTSFLVYIWPQLGY